MPRLLTSMSDSEWRAFLEDGHTAVLASSSRAGYPHLVAMWYLPEPDGLLMWTYAKSQKTLNLHRDPRVAALIESGEAYDDLRGVLIQGDAQVLDDPATVLRVGLALHERYPGEDSGNAHGDAAVRAQASKRVVVRVPYTRVISWDHRKLKTK
jgi:PPOX class probable F420-dependent enzyme